MAKLSIDPKYPLGPDVVASAVGYETEGLALVVLAGLALFAKAGVGSSTGLKIALILVAALVQLVLPLRHV